MIGSRLAIGTANFNRPYGVAQSQADSKSILSLVQCYGIDMLDTADAYGSVECNSFFKVVSKGEAIEEAFDLLNLDHLYAYLVHDPAKIRSAWGELLDAKREGLVTKIGVSVYHPKELQDIIREFRIDIVQLPYSVLDRRFEMLIPIIAHMGIEIHARSVFTQGAIWGNPPNNEIAAKAHLTRKHAQSIPIGAYCLNYVLLNPHIKRAVIGVDTVEHLMDNLSLLSSYQGLEADPKSVVPTEWKEKDGLENTV